MQIVGFPMWWLICHVRFSSFIRHKLDDNVRLSLYQACDDWMKVLGKRKYLGGDEPCIADLVSAFTPLLTTLKHEVLTYDVLLSVNIDESSTSFISTPLKRVHSMFCMMF